jgi:Family of unknown function (DUF6491)
MGFWPDIGRRTAAGAILAAAMALASAMPFPPARAAEDTQSTPADPDADQDNPLLQGLEGHRDRLPQGTLECVFFRSIYDWRAIDRYNLIIWAPNRSSPYRVQLDRPCDGLRFTDTIAFSSNLDGRLCAFGRDAVVVDHDRCPIGSITKLSQDDLDFLLSQEPGKKQKDDDKDKKDKKAKKDKKDKKDKD